MVIANFQQLRAMSLDADGLLGLIGCEDLPNDNVFDEYEAEMAAPAAPVAQEAAPAPSPGEEDPSVALARQLMEEEVRIIA